MRQLTYLKSLIVLALAVLLGTPMFAFGQARIIVEPTPVPDRRQPMSELIVRSHQVSVSIKDQVATTTIEQVFYNPSGRQLEGTLILPMPKGARIQKFKMDVNGKMTDAELLDAKKARSIYEEIVRKARDPALLEYVGQDLLKARIFPIEPTSEKRVVLSYTNLLPANFDIANYTLPLTGRTVDGKQHAKLAFKLELHTTNPIAHLLCPTHTLEITKHSPTHATLGMETNQLENRDLIITFSAPSVGDQQANVAVLPYRDGLADATGSKDGYALLMISPSIKTNNNAPLPKDIVFVVDTSGSMAGKKMDQAKAALQFCLANLNEQDRFEIVRFSTEAQPTFGKLVTANKQQCDQASKVVEQFRPIGGTAISDALDHAAKLLDRGGNRPNADVDDPRPSYIVFMTDGKPTIGNTDENSIVSQFATEVGKRGVRVFPLGIGTGVNTHLLDKLSEAHHGRSEYVLPEEDLEIKMSHLYTRISTPVLTNVQLIADGVTLSKQYPSTLPDLFKGDQLVVLARYDQPGKATLTLTANRRGEKVTQEIDLDLPEKATDNSFTPQLWAARRIGFLLDQIRLHGQSDELRDEVVQLARAFGIVTPYTSYLIVEDEARRNVPVARRTMRELERNRIALDTAGTVMDDMVNAKSGRTAVGGATANQTLREADQLGASAEASKQVADAAGPTVTTTPTQPGNVAGQARPADSRLNLERERQRHAGQMTQNSRFVRGRVFVQNATQWVDTQVQNVADQKPVRVAFNSDAYFKLMREHPEAVQWLSVGRNLQVVIAGQLYEVFEEAES